MTKKKRTKFYKVVTSELKSVGVQNLFEPFEQPLLNIQYIVGEYVKPKLEGSILFVFDSLDCVKRFKERYGKYYDYPVYEVEVKGCVKKIPFVYSLESLKAILLLKKRRKKVPRYNTTRSVMTWERDIPFGTVGVKEVKLVKLVENA